MSENVTISRELLQYLIDFAEHYTYADEYFKEKYDMDNEYQRLTEQVQAILSAPSPAPADTVTYTVYWQGRRSRAWVDGGGTGRPYAEALDKVLSGNSTFKNLNHWAIGTDGSIIGRVGAP